MQRLLIIALFSGAVGLVLFTMYSIKVFSFKVKRVLDILALVMISICLNTLCILNCFLIGLHGIGILGIVVIGTIIGLIELVQKYKSASVLK